MKKKEAEYLTVTEICKVLGIAISTFYGTHMPEKLPGYKIRKSIKYKKSDIEKLRI